MAVVGPGRSGTTWAGTLLDSSPEVIYRFEPFHRLANVEPEIREWFEKLKRHRVSDEDIPRIYTLLRKAHPLVNKPPFFKGKAYPEFTFGRSQMWPFARAVTLAGKVYSAAYSPPPGPPLVFKEVTFVNPIRNLLQRTSVPVVYLVRHPCATVLSEIKGQMEGKMPSWRQQHLREVLLEHTPALAERFADVVAGSDIVGRTALLWRCEVESCVPIVRQSKKGMLLTYEQLAEDAYTHARQLFGHFGLDYARETDRFIDVLYETKADKKKGARRTGWGDKYFSVYRNPMQNKDAWKSRITSEDRQKVESIVEDSPAVAYCATLGQW